MTPATYRGLVPSLLLLVAVALPARALDEPHNVAVPLDSVHVMLGTPGEVLAGWASRAVVGDASAGIPLLMVDLAAEQRTTLTAEGGWRPWWAAPISDGWLELDIQPDAWAAGAAPAWSGALRWRLSEHTADGQQPIAEGIDQPDSGTAASAGAAVPLVATDGTRVATWAQTLDDNGPAWHIVVRSLEDDSIVSERVVGAVSGLAVDDRGVAWTDAAVTSGVSQPGLWWAPAVGDAVAIAATDGTAATAISGVSLAGGQLVWLTADASWTADVSAEGAPAATTRLSSEDTASPDVVAADGGAA